MLVGNSGDCYNDVDMSDSDGWKPLKSTTSSLKVERPIFRGSRLVRADEKGWKA